MTNLDGVLKSRDITFPNKASYSQTAQSQSAFFMVQLSHPYMTTGKTIALTRWAFAGKVMSLCLQSPPAVILEPKK